MCWWSGPRLTVNRLDGKAETLATRARPRIAARMAVIVPIRMAGIETSVRKKQEDLERRRNDKDRLELEIRPKARRRIRTVPPPVFVSSWCKLPKA